MESMNIRPELWLGPAESNREQYHLPKAPYILNANERVTVIDIIRNLKTPTHYVGAILKGLEEGKLRYMKSHDFHVLMQQVWHRECL